MTSVVPAAVHSFPGSRIVFTAYDEDNNVIPLSTDGEVEEVLFHFPGREPANATIHETDHTFSWIVPPGQGTFEAEILLKRAGYDRWVGIQVTIDPAQAASMTFSKSSFGLTNPVFMDFYDPKGTLVHSEDVTATAPNYTVTVRPGLSWIKGEYRLVLRDANGVQDVDSEWVERPELASMTAFYELPVWQQQMVEYLKFEMMGDYEPMHPGAFFTLNEYALHWINVVGEINHVPPYTNFGPGAIPLFWANVTMKGTLLRVYHALANRAVTIPRWTGVPVMIQDESHYQQSWEQRYQALREEYKEERAYMKGLHLPGPSVTIDPWLGWGGGNLAGTAGMALIGRPTWFTRGFGGRG